MSSTIKLDTATPGSYVIAINGTSNYQISDVSIQGVVLERNQTDSTGWAIYGTFFGASQFRDIYVYGNNVVGNGFQFVNFNNISLHHVWSQNVVGTCVSIAGTTNVNTGIDFRMDDL